METIENMTNNMEKKPNKTNQEKIKLDLAPQANEEQTRMKMQL